MSKIADGVISAYENGQIVTKVPLNQANEILRTAINDNYARIIERYTKTEVDTLLNAMRGADWTTQTIKDNYDMIQDILATTYKKTEIDAIVSGLESVDANHLALINTKADKSYADSIQSQVNGLKTSKTDLTGDHKGTWHGLTPSQASEAINGGRLDVLEPKVNTIEANLNALADPLTLPIETGVNNVSFNNTSPAKVNIKGNTLVNLLGNYGNFEKDTDGDGLADGWSKGGSFTHSLSSNSLYGSKSQSIAIKAGSMYFSIQLQASHVYYMSTHLRLLTWDGTGDVSFGVRIFSGGINGVSKVVSGALYSNMTINKWEKLSNLYKSDGSEDTFTLRTGGNIIPDTPAILEIDGTMLVDLTEMFGAGNEPTKEWCDANLPYVDSVQSVENPGIVACGKNMFDTKCNPFMTTPNTTVASIEGGIRVTTTNGTYSYTTYKLDVKRNTAYYLNYNASILQSGTSDIRVYDSNFIKGVMLFSGKGSFNTGENDVIYILLYATKTETSGIVDYTDIQLEEGSVATAYEPYRETRVESSGTVQLHKIGDYQDELQQVPATKWQKLKRVNEVVLDGSLGWASWASYTGYRRFRVAIATAVTNKGLATKYTGVPLYLVEDGVPPTTGDTVAVASDGYVYVSVNHTDTGFSTHAPSSDDIKRYFNGWKYSDGVTWTSVTGNGQTATATTSLSTSPTDYTPYKLYYVLATPVVEEVDVRGQLVVEPTTKHIALDTLVHTNAELQYQPNLAKAVNEVTNDLVELQNKQQEDNASLTERIQVNAKDIYELALARQYEGKETKLNGLFFDGFTTLDYIERAGFVEWSNTAYTFTPTNFVQFPYDKIDTPLTSTVVNLNTPDLQRIRIFPNTSFTGTGKVKNVKIKLGKGGTPTSGLTFSIRDDFGNILGMVTHSVSQILSVVTGTTPTTYTIDFLATNAEVKLVHKKPYYLQIDNGSFDANNFYTIGGASSSTGINMQYFSDGSWRNGSNYPVATFEMVDVPERATPNITTKEHTFTNPINEVILYVRHKGTMKSCKAILSGTTLEMVKDPSYLVTEADGSVEIRYTAKTDGTSNTVKVNIMGQGTDFVLYEYGVILR